MRILNNMLYAALLALPLLASCSDDDEVQGYADAMQFKAEIQPLEGVSEGRSVPYNTWAGLDDRRVAVRIDGTVKAYTVDKDGNMTCDDPFLWSGRTSVAVDAWFPYNGGEKDETVLVRGDQNVPSNYTASDLIEVVQTNVSPENPALTFVHRTAKLVCRLSSFVEDFHTTITVRGVSGVEDEGNSVVMTNNYEALLAPQSIVANTLSLLFSVGDKRAIVCQVPEAIDLQAGRCHYIDVSVGEDYLVSATYIGSSADWNQEGSDETITGNSPTLTPGGGPGDWNDMEEEPLTGTVANN